MMQLKLATKHIS